jgi:RNA polymerase sigma-70 factor (sigma-E family)
MGGDEDFTAFVAARWANLVRAAIMLGCSHAEAEDVTQTALARCYVSWGRVTSADKPDAYVYRVLINCWAKSRRRRWHTERFLDAVPEVAEPDRSAVSDLRRDLLASLRELSDAHRTVVVLRFVADMTVPEIAEVLQVSSGTVKSRLSRALDALRLIHVDEEIP